MTPVLMIALEFGPVQTTGAFRSIDLARYFPDNGITPHVLTIEPHAGAEIFGARINKNMLASMPRSVSIHHMDPAFKLEKRGAVGEFLRIFANLDDSFYKRFHAPLTAQVKQLKEKHDFAAVYVSAPPFGAARLGELAAAILDKPLLLDMRDAWSEWCMAPYPTQLHYLARLKDERRAFAKASAVVTVTERLANVFRRTHATLPQSRFHVVHNGFDGPLLENKQLQLESKSDVFNIAYVGSFYYTPAKARSIKRPHSLLQYTHEGEDWSYRSPLYFFRAWQELNHINPELGERLRFHHIGASPAWLKPMAAEYGVAGSTKLWGVLPKDEVGPVLQGMHAQLATSMKRDDGGDYCLASKTFDYVLSEKPIVAFVTEGSQRDFLVSSGMAVVCDPDNPPSASEKLIRIIEGRTELHLDANYVNTFHRREGARQMADILNQIVASGSPEL